MNSTFELKYEFRRSASFPADHFKQEHYPCEHPQCLEQRFVVFPTEQELKTHTAREHGQSLSKAERKQALTLPVAFNVSAA